MPGIPLYIHNFYPFKNPILFVGEIVNHNFPTIYFPLLFHESMMIEPTETESMETLDEFIEVMHKVAKEARETPEVVLEAPITTIVRKLDETTAAKNPILTYQAVKEQEGE